MNSTSRRLQIALTGLFGALAFVLGRLPHPPNVECVTFAVFAAGYVGGTFVGVASGAILTFLQFTFGGGGQFLLAAAQLTCWGLTGAAGGFFSGNIPRLGILALTGAGLTVLYELATNAALMPATGLSWQAIAAGGAGWALLHVANNTLVFEAGRLLLLALERHPAFVQMRRSAVLPGS